MKKQLIFMSVLALILQVNSQNVFPTPTGNVGIGITGSPTKKLDIGVANPGDGIKITSSSQSAGLHMQGNGGHLWSMYSLGSGDGWAGYGGLAFHDATGNPNSPRMIIDRFGKVGIGCNAPNADLHIGDGWGNLHFAGAKGLLLKFASGDRALMELHDPSGQNRLILESLIDASYLASLDLKPLRLQYWGGSVIIGEKKSISQPNSKLMVDGTIACKEIFVTAPADWWPDYVFSGNYKLMSLENLEYYIKKYNHLPNVPSATEIDCAGVNLGEINKMQMEKIEELTLYVIELKKEIEAMKKEILKNK